MPLLSTSQLTPGQSSPSQSNNADAFLAPHRPDRPDGFCPTGFAKGGCSLGLYIHLVNTSPNLYSQEREFITPGDTVSGGGARLLVQHWHRMSYASITTRYGFLRVQRHPATSRVLRPSCFGEFNGLAGLEATLESRSETTREGFYTNSRLNDLTYSDRRSWKGQTNSAAQRRIALWQWSSLGVFEPLK